MEFAKSLIDYGSAPEIHVDGVARIIRPTTNVIHVSYFKRFMVDGRIENRISGHVVWDREIFMAATEIFQRAKAADLPAMYLAELRAHH